MCSQTNALWCRPMGGAVYVVCFVFVSMCAYICIRIRFVPVVVELFDFNQKGRNGL